MNAVNFCAVETTMLTLITTPTTVTINRLIGSLKNTTLLVIGFVFVTLTANTFATTAAPPSARCTIMALAMTSRGTWSNSPDSVKRSSASDLTADIFSDVINMGMMCTA